MVRVGSWCVAAAVLAPTGAVASLLGLQLRMELHRSAGRSDGRLTDKAAAFGGENREAGMASWRDARGFGLQSSPVVRRPAAASKRRQSDAAAQAGTAANAQNSADATPSWLSTTVIGLQRGVALQRKAPTVDCGPKTGRGLDAGARAQAAGAPDVQNREHEASGAMEGLSAGSWSDSTALGLQRGVLMRRKARAVGAP
mmetsp:Transcript_30101/g.82709  ORF Transcript_30101/g.82709 Transcript_30101/m.82709 type:complete len:199 (-) Transcript_30101:207-803(-)